MGHRSPRTPPSVLVKRDLLQISRFLTVDLTDIEAFVRSTWPITNSLVTEVSRFVKMGDVGVLMITKNTMMHLWERKDDLKKAREPGGVIAFAIINKIREYCKENGLESEYQKFCGEIKKYINLSA